jgi:redox-sensitive bicupin YhaK (pirin superfamily)
MLSGTVASANALSGKIRNVPFMKTLGNNMNNPIKKIHPLGFMWPTTEPFLFLAHHLDNYPKGNDDLGPDPALLKGRNMGQDFEPKDGWRMYHGKKVPGFPVHPHRGFETVTIVLKGFVDHSDSLGASGRYGEGDVQWMTAGKGVQHAEMFPLLNKESENICELFQIWLNLPKNRKFAEPAYKMFWSEKIPVVINKDSNGKQYEVMVIAGDFDGVKAIEPPKDSWASDHENRVGILKIKMEANAELTIPADRAGLSRMLYVYEGDGVEINGQSLDNYNSAELSSEIELVVRNGNKESLLLFLQAKPIGEPVVQYGPFVMNTEEEIQQAYSDYRKTQFGGWPWERHDPVHSEEKKRFARHADGQEEFPS